MIKVTRRSNVRKLNSHTLGLLKYETLQNILGQCSHQHRLTQWMQYFAQPSGLPKNLPIQTDKFQSRPYSKGLKLTSIIAEGMIIIFLNGQFKSLPNSVRCYFSSYTVSSHLVDTVSGHSKFILSYQFTSIQQSLFILDFKKSSVINFFSMLQVPIVI